MEEAGCHVFKPWKLVEMKGCSQITKTSSWQFFVTFLGWLSDLLERLSDLQLGDEKVTLNHLELISTRHDHDFI